MQSGITGGQSQDLPPPDFFWCSITTDTRELKDDGFFLAEKLWEQYRGQKADPDLYFGRIL